MPATGIGRFYAMVGALLWREADGAYLVLRRTADKDFGQEAGSASPVGLTRGKGSSRRFTGRYSES